MEPDNLQTMPETIVFDTSSGISLEEQEEILEGINAMSAGNRLAPGEAAVGLAKKKGYLFPLLVNIGALVLLGLGFALLYFFHGYEEQGIRESSSALGITERKMIQEIREETNRLLGEKESQINDILSKLAAADSEYRQLQDSMGNLTEAQQERAAALRLIQDEYRHTLSGLQEERYGILEDARIKEAALRAEAEERITGLSEQIGQSQASLDAAMEELRRLSNEQERAARVESQMTGYYITETNLISAGRLDEASATLQSMKDYLNARSLQGIRSLEARRQSHFAAIDAMEAAVDEARRYQEASAFRESGASGGDSSSGTSDAVQIVRDDAALAELQARYTALEQRAADLERTIAAFSSQGSEQSRMISEFNDRISGLNAENERLSAANVNQQQTLNRQDSEIQALRIENTDLQAQVQAANARASASEASLAEQQRQNSTMSQERQALQSEIDDLRSRGDALRRLLE